MDCSSTVGSIGDQRGDVRPALDRAFYFILPLSHMQSDSTFAQPPHQRTDLIPQGQVIAVSHGVHNTYRMRVVRVRERFQLGDRRGYTYSRCKKEMSWSVETEGIWA